MIQIRAHDKVEQRVARGIQRHKRRFLDKLVQVSAKFRSALVRLKFGAVAAVFVIGEHDVLDMHDQVIDERRRQRSDGIQQRTHYAGSFFGQQRRDHVAETGYEIDVYIAAVNDVFDDVEEKFIRRVFAGIRYHAGRINELA